MKLSEYIIKLQEIQAEVEEGVDPIVTGDRVYIKMDEASQPFASIVNGESKRHD